MSEAETSSASDDTGTTVSYTSSRAVSQSAASSGAPASASSGTSASAAPQSASLAAYDGQWQADDNDSYYGSWLELKIDGDRLSGNLSRDTRDSGMLADADFTGSVADGKGRATFDDDSRGHAGTIELAFATDAIDATVSYNKGADAPGFGVRTGSIHFVRRG